jgi:dissimilatory sulfite reductase (desulfoviridin) alpha/beta subunit
VADVTACPGTDTCNLGISDSTHVAKVIEQLIQDEYPEFIYNQEIKIKISGCMNSCGQHGLAHIGFHGSSQKVNGLTVPALQVLLGGGKLGNGFGRIAEKVIKIPSKRVLDIIRYLLNDYSENQLGDELFNEYYDRQGNKYFYDLLKPLADTTTLKPLLMRSDANFQDITIFYDTSIKNYRTNTNSIDNCTQIRAIIGNTEVSHTQLMDQIALAIPNKTDHYYRSRIKDAFLNNCIVQLPNKKYSAKL